MTAQDIFKMLQAKFGENVIACNEETRPAVITFEAAAVLEIMRYLKDTAELDFDMLSCLTCIDEVKDERIDVVYTLDSVKHEHMISMKAMLPRGEAKIQTVTSIWNAVDWHEREGYDMFGVVFEGHANLVRILMPEDWQGHPLLKDYKPAKVYNGIPTE